MWKMLGLLALGVVAGGVVVHFRGTDSSSGAWPGAAGADGQVAAMQRSLTALERQVQDLTAQVESLRESRGRMAQIAPGGERAPAAGTTAQAVGELWQRVTEGRAQPDVAALRERAQQRDLARITAAGLTPERMAAIERRTEELRVAGMQAQYEAQRNGQRSEFDIDQALRKDLGDADYERYLQAQGRPTTVRVMDVLATSAAERSGLQRGDEIISYGGTRVFATRDLNALALAGAPGESVTLEVRRGNQTVQVVVPRGPLGVTAGAGGGRQGGGPGGPGGQGAPGGFRSGR